MSSITCTKCGAEIVAGSRFCRRCGQPAPVAERDGSSVLEAETRVFATPTDYATPTQHINSPLTGPAYMSPGHVPTTPAAATKPLKPSGSTAKFALIGILLILLIVPISFAIVTMLRSHPSHPSQPPPPVVAEPEIPRPPAPPTLRGGPTSADNALIYPGSEIVMTVNGQGDGHEGNVLQLRTRDSVDKVVQWYAEKLKPNTSMVKVPGDAVTILRGDGINVVITSKDAQTEIIVNQGSE